MINNGASQRKQTYPIRSLIFKTCDEAQVSTSGSIDDYGLIRDCTLSYYHFHSSFVVQDLRVLAVVMKRKNHPSQRNDSHDL
jgi:hypothetical protein